MKKLLPIIIALVVIGGGAFYGGMRYGQGTYQISKNLSPEQQQLLQKKAGGAFPGGIKDKGTGSNFLNGEVIDKDEQSLTLKMLDGGSKIVFFSDSTKVSKTTDGLMNDIEIGKKITVSGEQNSDGSYTAETIQLSPRVIQPGE